MSDYGESNTPTKMGTHYTWTAANGLPTTPRYAILSSRSNKAFYSQSNPFKNGHYTDGGNFLSVKRVFYHSPSAAVTVWRPGFGVAYKGQFTAGFASFTNSAVSTSANASALTNLSQKGSRAWNRLRPDKPDFSLATSLGELKDMPGMLKDAVNDVRKAVGAAHKKSGKSHLSKTGQYYLAIEFGWLPLLSDIQNFIKAQNNGQKRLAQLIRDNGRPVKRTAQMETSHSVDNMEWDPEPDGWGGSLSPLLVTQCYKRYHSTYRCNRGTTSSRTWAEGVFRYHLPPGPRTVVWKKKMLRRLMGARVTPDVVYNLMPWTWLVDYFTDLGQFIQAVSPGVADRLAADYAYVMQTDIWTRTREGLVVVQGSKKEDAQHIELTASTTLADVRKMRHRASPFGWGVNQSSLTPKQWAILGALGLSKLP